MQPMPTVTSMMKNCTKSVRVTAHSPPVSV